MDYNFSNQSAGDAPARQGSVFGIDQETVHRIREQTRIERAKVVRQCFAMLKRLAVAAPPARVPHEPSEPATCAHTKPARPAVRRETSGTRGGAASSRVGRGPADHSNGTGPLGAPN